MHVLVCGGAGYIGSHTSWFLRNQGHQVTVLDNFSTGHRRLVEGFEVLEADLLKPEELKSVFESHNFDCVMHFAGLIAVGESVLKPGLYYRNNVTGMLNLLDAMIEGGCLNLVFSSTAAIFGQPDVEYIDEETPKNPINPYGRTKLYSEQIFEDYAWAYGLKTVSLRYFNACGRAPGTHLYEMHEPETHLIPLVLEVVHKQRSHIKVFGDDYPTPDGTCIRDYIHVLDLADAHEKAMLWNLENQTCSAFNLGNAQGYSVAEVISSVERVFEQPVASEVCPRREGDPARLVASSRKARSVLHWCPKYPDLDSIIHTLKE